MKSALIYPVAVVSMAVLIVGALLKWVVPIFANLFAGLGVALPLPTRIVMGLSAFVGRLLVDVLRGSIRLFFGIKQVRKHPTGRYYFDKMLLYVPVIGHAAAQDRGRPLHPYSRNPDHFRRARFWKG